MHSATRTRLAVVLALGLALQATLLWLELTPRPRTLWGDEIMYTDLATRWARGEPAMLELLWPPLYPRLLALATHVDDGLLAARLAQIACLVIAVLLWRDLAHRLTGSAVAADVTAALMLLDPQVAAFTQFLWPETLHQVLFAAALWILVTRPPRPVWLALAGIVLGGCLLVKSLLGPFLPVLLLPLWRGTTWWRGAGRSGVVAAACFLTVLPTMLDHARHHGAFIVANAARLNVWIGLNDVSPRNLTEEIAGDEYRRWQESAPTFAERERILDEKIAGLVRERGLAAVTHAQLLRQYRRLLHHDSFFTDQLPGGAIAVLGFGYPDPPRILASFLRLFSGGIYVTILIGAGLGLAALPRDHSGWLPTLLAFVAYNLALFFLLHVKTRYRLQFMPVLDLLAGVGMAIALGQGPPLGSWTRCTVAFCLSALSLYLAFA